MARLFSAFDAARLLLAAVFLIGIGALGIALLGEHVFGIQPCILCLYQRVPYFISAVLAGAAAALPVSFGARRLALALCGIVFTAGAALAFYSVGVEEHWWVGVPGCDGNPTTNFTVDDIRKLSATASSLRSCDATCGGSLVSRLPHTMPSRSYWRPALAFWCYVGCRDDALVLSLRPSPFLQKGLEQQLSPRIARWNETTRSAIRFRSAWRLQRRQSTKLCGRPFLCARQRSWHLGSALCR